jgi:hypothetical protein
MDRYIHWGVEAAGRVWIKITPFYSDFYRVEIL